MDKSFLRRKSYLISGLILLAAIVAIGFLLTSRSSLPENLWQVVGWDNHKSSSANVAFDYPKGWVVTDQVMSDSSIKNGKRDYNIITICPSQDQFIAAPKEFLNNCINFFTKDRILHPLAGFSDESSFFTDFARYITEPEGYTNFRIFEETSSSDGDGAVYLVGLYRENKNLMGMTQLLCSPDKTATCLLTFKHVLDSIRFLK